MVEPEILAVKLANDLHELLEREHPQGCPESADEESAVCWEVAQRLIDLGWILTKETK